MRNNYISRRVLDELSKEYSIFFKEEEILYIERYTEVIELKRNEFLIHKDDQLESCISWKAEYYSAALQTRMKRGRKEKSCTDSLAD